MTKMTNKSAKVSAKVSRHDDSSLHYYFREINRIPLLTKEEEEEVAKRAAEGDKEAKEKMVKSNLRFVIMIAKKYEGMGLPLADLISEGNLGLLHAVEVFDVQKGFRFITYAVWWIRQAIIKALCDKSRIIRLPSQKVEQLMKIKKSRDALQTEGKLKVEDEIREVSASLNISPEKAADLISADWEVVFLDDQVSITGDNRTYEDYIADEFNEAPDETAIRNIMREDVEEAVSSLEKKYADIVRSRYGLGNTGAKTLHEVGNSCALTRERVRQIEKLALLQLQQSECCRKLESYVAG